MTIVPDEYDATGNQREIGAKRAQPESWSRAQGVAWVPRSPGLSEKRGAAVAVHYHGSAAGAKSVAKEIGELGGSGHPLRADLYDLREARGLVDDAVSVLGGLDTLVLSAANFDRVPLGEVSDAYMERALSLNLRAPVAMALQGLSALRASSGSIVFITGTGATRPYPNYLPYLISKGAVRQAMRTLAIECAPEVRVNAVAPGTVLPPEDMDEKAVARLVRRIPLGRVGTKEDVANAVVELSGSRFVTGAEWVIDGGRSLT